MFSSCGVSLSVSVKEWGLIGVWRLSIAIGGMKWDMAGQDLANGRWLMTGFSNGILILAL